jgi:beta-phosphoglucomutase
VNLQAIVFDFDGVIANSEPLHLRAFQQTLSEEGIALSAAEYYARYLGYDDVGMFESLGRDRGLDWSNRSVEALVARKGAAMQALLHSGDVLFPGAAEFIRASAAALPVAVASGAMREEIVQILRAAGLGDLFRVIVAAGDTPESKPSPAPYRLAIELLGQEYGALEPARCVAIEDSQWGLASARGAGLRCVGVTTSYAADALTGADLVAGGLGELTLARLDALVDRGMQRRRDTEKA